MIKKISMLAVTAAAFAVVLAGCVKAPATPVTPSLQGTWSFAPAFPNVTATIDGADVMVTALIVPGTTNPALASVTKVEVDATLHEDAEEMTFKLTVDDIAVSAEALTGQARGDREAVAKGVIQTMLAAVQDQEFMINLDTSIQPDQMTLTGSFIVALLDGLGAMVPEGGLTAIRIG